MQLEFSNRPAISVERKTQYLRCYDTVVQRKLLRNTSQLQHLSLTRVEKSLKEAVKSIPMQYYTPITASPFIVYRT